MHLLCALVILLIVLLIVFIATRPERFRIERSRQIDAPPPAVFPLINDFHQWHRWSPFEKLDPNMKKTFEGPESGPGAVYAWSGNSKAGEGRMTVLQSKPAELVVMKLEFFKPFAATNQANFTLAPSGSGTRVSWSMEGKNTLMGKVMSLFMNMDKMVGKAFEEGLDNLNTVAKTETRSAS